jgi:hypothetical protein
MRIHPTEVFTSYYSKLQNFSSVTADNLKQAILGINVTTSHRGAESPSPGIKLQSTKITR